jgi:hypothetical protein
LKGLAIGVVAIVALRTLLIWGIVAVAIAGFLVVGDVLARTIAMVVLGLIGALCIKLRRRRKPRGLAPNRDLFALTAYDGNRRSRTEGGWLSGSRRLGNRMETSGMCASGEVTLAHASVLK